MRNIIDFHTHLGTSRSSSMDARLEQTLIDGCQNQTALMGSMDRNGIEKSVVFSVPMLPHKQREANEEVLQLVEENGRLIPFAFLDPRLEETPALLEELIERGVRGVKLHPICHGYIVSHHAHYPLFEVAQKYALPVLVHTGWGEYGEVRFVKKCAADFKNLRIVIGHLVEWKDIFEQIPPHENVSVETSYSTHPRRIAQAVRVLGADRLVFGSDFPCATQDFELYKVLTAPISDGEKEKVLYRNAQRLLRLDKDEQE